MYRKLAITGLITVCIYMGGIAAYGLFSKSKKSDLCVVLGTKVNSDGQPSDRLIARLNKAVELYRKDMCRQIIVSGGIGQSGYNEASVMSDYLIKCSIPAEIIVQDSSGVNTHGTASFVSYYCKSHECKSVIGVSQYFHLLRTKMAFKNLGIEKVSVESPWYFEIRDVYSIAREAIGIPVYLLK